MSKEIVSAAREVLESLRDFSKGDKAFTELLPKPLVSYGGWDFNALVHFQGSTKVSCQSLTGEDALTKWD